MSASRIAMIGAGGIARRHLDVLRAEPDVTLVGSVAGRRASAERLAAAYGGQAFDDLAALLAAEQVDAAWICVPPFAHGPIERALIERGVPFFVEKPLSADAGTAEAIAAAVAQAGIVTAVGYHWRALDTLSHVRERIAAGRAVRLVTGAWHSSTPPPAWWRHEAQSGGQMVEQATHLVDLALHLLGDAEVLHAATVRGTRASFPDADVAEATSATLRFATGAIGTITATCVLAATAQVELRLHLEGEQIAISQEAVAFDTGSEQRLLRRRADPFAAQDRAFIEAVRAREPTRVLCSYHEALRAHRLAHAIRAATNVSSS